ncbi:hypothetical protein ACJX0J_008125, partial [Zea mays]
LKAQAEEQIDAVLVICTLYFIIFQKEKKTHGTATIFYFFGKTVGRELLHIIESIRLSEDKKNIVKASTPQAHGRLDSENYTNLIVLWKRYVHGSISLRLGHFLSMHTTINIILAPLRTDL